MRQFPITVLTLAALAAGSTPLLADSSTWREQSEWVRDAHGVAMVSVDDARGEIHLAASPDDRIHLKALKVVRGGSLDDAKRIAGETVVELDESGGRLAIRVRYPHLHVSLNLWQNMSGERVPMDEVRLSIELPASLAVEATSASGDVTSESLAGSQRLHTASGDVTVSDASGPVTVSSASGDVSGQALAAARVNTASGDVSMDGVRGGIDIESTSGDVAVRGAVDSVRVRTVSGTVRIDDAPRGADVGSTSGEVTLGSAAGRVRVHTVSGDLEVRLRPGLRAADLGTQSGGLSVTLEPGLACSIDAGTSSGEIDLGGSSSVTRHGHGRAIATYGGGGAAVGLRTVSGDIRVVVGGGR
ncbi:MAG: DUF4097 family beta strand repeat-containing protein [Candidatus Eisenbacteria bacterium]